jgi:hypothetical protein
LARDYRDLTIESLTAEVLNVERQRNTWRALAQAAIHRLHDQHVEFRRLQERHERLIDEYRALRADRMRRAA